MTKSQESPFLTLRIRNPGIRVRAVRDGAAFQLEAVKGANRTVVELAPAALQTLALECLHAGAGTFSGFAVHDIEEAFKRPARALKAYGRLAISEVTSRLGTVDLAAFLWYMQDRQLIEQFVHELPHTDATRLVSELDFYTLFDRSDDDTLKIGRRATLKVMQVLQAMTDDESPVPDAGEAT